MPPTELTGSQQSHEQAAAAIGASARPWFVGASLSARLCF
jgi:hypothetical protein